MNITEVRIRLKNKEDSKIKAIASLTIDNCFVVHDIKIIEGNESLYIAMPSRKTPEGEYKDIAHPLNSETRDIICKTIIESYNTAKEKADETAS